MPTSNQALILKKGVLTEDEVRPTSSGHRSGSQCSVPTVVSDVRWAGLVPQRKLIKSTAGPLPVDVGPTPPG
ncbi:hypothetical protein DPMN_064202 [Dreissena polymorpha]|uniref:Uncharacterized protein n=1 Tax=Dreissena polymorpha TaxID=45954 RepID=A0A9D4CCR9_DREPO|nr:hypothetical protein DPMN_064202 [Dreissena polymorpha]